MAHIDVKVWWERRQQLNVKMLRMLRDELLTMRTSARVALSLEKPPVGIEVAVHMARTESLIADLDDKVREVDQMLENTN